MTLVRRMRTAVVAVALSALVALPAGLRATPFADVPSDHWTYQAIQSLAADGLIDGYPDGAFKGDRPLSRYEMAAIVARARAVVGDGPVYLSFDIDSLDPAFAPGTGTPEVGGLTSREVLELLRGLKGVNLVGGDVVEVAPQYDPTTNTAQAGAQMLFEILSLMVFSPAIAGR